MARQTGILNFTGKLGNLIGYKRNENYFLRSMPQSVRQTTATRKAARNFSIASRKGKLIRRAVMPHLDIRTDSALINRLNKALIQQTPLEGFRFNKHTGVEQFFTRPPVISQNKSVTIPAQVFLPQHTATHLEIKAIAVRINFPERRITGSSTSTVMIDLNASFDGAELETYVPGNGILLMVLQVRAYKGEIMIEDRRFMAADIIMVTQKMERVKESIPPIARLLSYQLRGNKKSTPVLQCLRE